MRELILLRHVKSSWNVPDSDDHERDLAPRGLKAAGRIGRFMRKNEMLPDIVLCSTAKRAQRTLDLVSEEWKAAIEAQHLKGLYLASPGQILAIVQRQADSINRLLVVGHNPGIASLAAQLYGSGDQAAADAIAVKYPTGGLAHFRCHDASSWPEVVLGRGELIRFVQPRQL